MPLPTPKAAAAPDQKHSKSSAVCALHIPPRWSLCRKTADIPALSPFGAFRRLVFDFPNINRKQCTIRCARNIIISFLCLRKSFEENNSFFVHYDESMNFCVFFIIFTFYFLYTIHRVIIPIASFRSLVDHYAISITTKKNIPQNILFMKCSFLFLILIRNLIDRICHSIYVFVTI